MYSIQLYTIKSGWIINLRHIVIYCWHNSISDYYFIFRFSLIEGPDQIIGYDFLAPESYNQFFGLGCQVLRLFNFFLESQTWVRVTAQGFWNINQNFFLTSFLEKTWILLINRNRKNFSWIFQEQHSLNIDLTLIFARHLHIETLLDIGFSWWSKQISHIKTTTVKKYWSLQTDFNCTKIPKR